MKSNYQIIIVDCITRKTLFKCILSNVTAEQAQMYLQSSREKYTWKTGHYCDGTVKTINK